MRDSGRLEPEMLRREPLYPEFDRYAGSYATLLEDPLRDRFAQDPLHFHRRKWLLLQRLLQRANAAPATLRWLDVGCGQGELLALAGGHFAQAGGCDPSAGMLSSHAPFPMKQQPSLVELPFDDASVDFVTVVCVYHHVHGTARTLLTEEISRVLVPGGFCCIIEHNPWNPVARAIVRRCPVDADAELLTPATASTLLRGAGFKTVSLDHFLYFPERVFGFLGAFESALHKVPFGGQYALLARAPAQQRA